MKKKNHLFGLGPVSTGIKSVSQWKLRPRLPMPVLSAPVSQTPQPGLQSMEGHPPPRLCPLSLGENSLESPAHLRALWARCYPVSRTCFHIPRKVVIQRLLPFPSPLPRFLPDIECEMRVEGRESESWLWVITFASENSRHCYNQENCSPSQAEPLARRCPRLLLPDFQVNAEADSEPGGHYAEGTELIFLKCGQTQVGDLRLTNHILYIVAFLAEDNQHWLF